MILETMVTTDGADIHTASTHVTLNGFNVVQYHTHPGKLVTMMTTCTTRYLVSTCNVVPCICFTNHHMINNVLHVPAHREAIDAENCSLLTCIVIQVGTWHVR